MTPCLCGRSFTSRGMSKHLPACKPGRTALIEALDRQAATYEAALADDGDRPLHLSRASLTVLLQTNRRKRERLGVER